MDGTQTADQALTEGLHADDLLGAVAQLRHRVRRIAGRPWPAIELSGAQVELVRLLRRRPGMSVAEAAGELGVAANTVSTLVRQLTDLGLLARTADTADRRIARLALTPSTQRHVEQWRDKRSVQVAEAISRLTPQERDDLAKAVPAINRLADLLNPELSPEP